MSQFNEWHKMAKENKAMYPPGTRISLLNLNDSLHPVPSGTRGTVIHVDDGGNIHMKWDNGSSLSLIPGVDQFVKIK